MKHIKTAPLALAACLALGLAVALGFAGWTQPGNVLGFIAAMSFCQ